jgi:hypothetical protein
MFVSDVLMLNGSLIRQHHPLKNRLREFIAGVIASRKTGANMRPLNPISPVAKPCCNCVIPKHSPHRPLDLEAAMRRRDFIKVVASSTAAWPLTVHAQQSVRRIAVLIGLPQDNSEALKWGKAFLDGLPPLGWKPDANLRIDWRWTSDPGQMRELAKEIVETQPDLIVSTTTPMTDAVLRETHTIPVVFAVVSDPVGSPGDDLCGPYPQRRTTGRFAGSTSDEI